MSRVKELTKWQKYLTNFFRIATIGMIPIAMSVPVVSLKKYLHKNNVLQIICKK